MYKPSYGAAAFALLAAYSAISALAAMGVPGGQSGPSDAGSEPPQIATVRSMVHDAMKQYHLKSLIVQVRCGGKDLYTEALGESMSGVPATPAMHFRNGAMALTYMATMMLELVDQGKVSLSEKLANYLPEIPNADRVSLLNLANMTSGYVDYVYQPQVVHGTNLDPFRQWTSDELIQIGVSLPLWFDPGTNWAYSHTNYVILGKVLEKVTGLPLAEAMRKYIFAPMDLKQTQSNHDTPEIPAPVLHSFSSERRADLQVPTDIPFYEEATFWNPSWTTAEGGVQTTDISDMSTSIEAIGTGKLLSRKSWAAQIDPHLIGFGETDPNCPPCRENTAAFNYGLGLSIVGSWITQTKGFAGSSATTGYLRSNALTLTVVTTYNPEAFDEQGNLADPNQKLFVALGKVLAPNTLP